MAKFQDRQKKRQLARAERQKKQEETELAVVKTPPSTQTGDLKIIQLILNKGKNLVASLIPVILNQAKQLGIENLGQASEKLPDACPPQEVLDKVLNIRNSLVTKLNSTSESVQTLGTTISGLATLADVQTLLVNTLSITKTGASLAAKVLPVVPGAVPALLSDLEDLKNSILFTATGGPKLERITSVLSSGTLALANVNQQLIKIINLLNSIDNVLKKCNPDIELTPLNSALSDLQSVTTQSTTVSTPTEVSTQQSSINNYKGFILEIQESQFSENLIQKIGVAKNASGIVLLKTSPSFTNNPQTLIEELQFIIDRDNLKAN
jgi:hypothetical protein